MNLLRPSTIGADGLAGIVAGTATLVGAIVGGPVAQPDRLGHQPNRPVTHLPTLPDPRVGFDLDAIVAAGWIDPTQVPPRELAIARRFWAQRQRDGIKRAAAVDTAITLIQGWTGRPVFELGSTALELHLPDSDVDLALSHGGHPDDVHAQLAAAHIHPQADARTQSGMLASHHTWTCTYLQINLCVFDDHGLDAELALLDRVRATLTPDEAALYTLVKHELRRTDHPAYETWKTHLYQRFP